MSELSSTTRKGSCLCKSIKYEVIGDPISLRVCHCINCRKATGSAFMTNGFFKKENVHLLEGRDKLKVYRDKDTASGTPIDRFFCMECGSNVFMSSLHERSNSYIVMLGTLDDEIDWAVRKEMFAEQRRHFIKGIDVHSTPHSKL